MSKPGLKTKPRPTLNEVQTKPEFKTKAVTKTITNNRTLPGTGPTTKRGVKEEINGAKPWPTPGRTVPETTSPDPLSL